MFRWLNLLLLFCFINYNESSAVGNVPVTGKKGGNVTLQCKSEDREITVVNLSSLSKNILVCENEECKSENDRVFKEGSCDIIIKDLKLRDAGKYILYVYYKNALAEVEQQFNEYQLHIHGEISVKKGEDLKLDVLLINADKVERNSSSGWTELWTRGHGVNSDRLTVSHKTLIINEFTVNDTGTYRVLDSNNQTWITVTVTESSTDSPGESKDNEQDSVDIWIIGLSVCGALLALAGVIVFVVIKKSRRRNELYLQPSYQSTEK